MKDYYKILSIEKNADQTLIKKAFKRLAKEFHPDLNKSSNTQVEFLEIKEAYDVLSDRFKRIQYNNLYNAQITITLRKEKQKTQNIFAGNPLFGKDYVLVFSLFAFFLIAFSFYYYNQKSKHENLLLLNEQKEREHIEITSNTYFKNIEEEVSEDDLQDFTIYKDVQEVAANNNSKENKNINVLLPTRRRSKRSSQKRNVKSVVIKTKKNSYKNSVVGSNTKNTTIKPQGNNTEVQKNKVVLIENNNVTIKKDAKTKPFELYQKREPVIASETRVYVDKLKIVSLQRTKKNKYIKPKKIKNLNALKIGVTLSKSKKASNNKIDIMLVVKNTLGKTLIIDVKEVDFGNKETMPITFYENFKDKLVVGKEYTFSFLANKRIIKTTTKRI